VTLVWLAAQFVAAAAVILVAGMRLSRYGDIIAEKTGLGGTWVGLVMLATVTSVPELVTGASAILIVGAPDIAAGDAIGSCMFNLVILAFLDFRHPAPLSASIHQGHVLAAAFGIVQLGLAALVIGAGDRAPMVGWVGVHSIVFLLVYVFAIRTIFAFERRRLADLAEVLTGDIKYSDESLGRAVALYAAFAIVLIAAAVWLPIIADRLAVESGLGQSFVGSVFVAISTSLPEVAVSIAAARMGALDMAAANLFGSNLFNIALLGIDDVLYRPGSLLDAVSASHASTLIAAMMMTAAAIIGLTYRAQRKRFRLSYDALAILALYLIGAALLAR
jgi:cation:H+ antiporter